MWFKNQNKWGENGLATFSKYPIINKKKIEYQSADNVSIYSDIVIGNDTIRVINNHLESNKLNKEDRKFAEKLIGESNKQEILDAGKKVSNRIASGALNRVQQAKAVQDVIKTTDYPIIALGDFNDVDKYLADPKQLFANVADLKQLQDDYSYLTEAQRKAIEGFVSHFSDMSGKLTVDLESDNPAVKERFLQIWNLLYPLYCKYNDLLDQEGLAYEGMVYRSLAEQPGNFDDKLKYVFVDWFHRTEEAYLYLPSSSSIPRYEEYLS